VDLAHLLVEHGADVQSEDNDGLTSLHMAVLKEHVDLARFLVDHGADTAALTGLLHYIWPCKEKA
jgi:ankyrin repeat protein